MKLLLASSNQGKIKELQALLKDSNIEVISTSQFDHIIEPKETGNTFTENAIIKAEYYGKTTGMLALADDSGLSIDALDGFPGVISADIAGENRDYPNAFSLLKDMLKEKGLSSSPASFTCVLALRHIDGKLEQFQGKIQGTVKFPATGNGFGYDPIFTPDGYDKTFAELGSEIKNQISHRVIALKKLLQRIKKN